jgi:hypothetical protein
MRKKLVKARDIPKGYLTLDIVEKVDAQLGKIEQLLRKSEELYFGKKKAAELRRQGVYEKIPSPIPWIDQEAEQLRKRPPGKTGPQTEIMRDFYIFMIVRSCVDELPRIRGSVARAYRMTQILLLKRHKLTISISGIRTACDNAERALESVQEQPYLPLK